MHARRAPPGPAELEARRVIETMAQCVAERGADFEAAMRGEKFPFLAREARYHPFYAFCREEALRKLEGEGGGRASSSSASSAASERAGGRRRRPECTQDAQTLLDYAVATPDSAAELLLAAVRAPDATVENRLAVATGLGQLWRAQGRARDLLAPHAGALVRAALKGASKEQRADLLAEVRGWDVPGKPELQPLEALQGRMVHTLGPGAVADALREHKRQGGEPYTQLDSGAAAAAIASADHERPAEVQRRLKRLLDEYPLEGPGPRRWR